MSLAAPLGLLTAALAVPLVLWYVLRSRRPRVTVSSTLLWRAADASVAAAVPWQRFRPDRTFWLVLAALLVGALALAQPAMRVDVALGDHTILVVDASASMLADEDGPTRLELARREADELLEGLGPGQSVSVVEAGTRARVLLSDASDAGAARRAVRSVAPAEAGADLSDAFTLAAALQRPGQRTVVHLLTDGAVPAAHEAAAPEGLQVTAVGSPRPNLAVTALQAVPSGAGDAQVFASVRNHGASRVEAQVALSADGIPLGAQHLSIGPRATEDVVADVTLPATGDAVVLRAHVSPIAQEAAAGAPDAADALAVDDAAFTVVTPSRDLVALVAGPGNVFVESALRAVGGIEVRTTPRVPSDLAGVDLLVVDRVAGPVRATVPTLYVAPARAADGIELLEPVASPAVTFQTPGHPILSDVDLSGLAVAEGTPLDAPGLETLASGPDGVLLAAGRAGTQPVVVVGFDVLASNLGVQVAWPILVSNAVTWLTAPPAATAVSVGQEVTLQPPATATGVEVAPPSGDPVRLDPLDPRLRLDRVGVWQPRWLGTDEGATPIAVNPLADEGDLARARPRETAGGGEVVGETASLSGRRVVGPGLLTVALVLLVAEWLSTHGVRPLHALGRRRRARRRAAVRA